MDKKKLIFKVILLVMVFSIASVWMLFAAGKKEKVVPKVTEPEVTVEEWSLEKAAAPYRGQTLKVIFEPWAGMQAFEDPVEEFTRITGINVDIEYADYDERQVKTKSDFLAGTHIYDFSMVSWREVGINAENDWMEPMEKFLNDPKLRDPSFDPFKLLPKPMIDASSLWKGTYYGVTCFSNVPIMIYRKDIATNTEEKTEFNKKYGYEFPIKPGNYFPLKNYKQYTEICEFFTRKKGERLAGKVLKDDFYGTTIGFKQHPTAPSFLEKFMVAFGGWYYDDTGKPTLNSQENVNALEYMLSLRKYCPPGYLEATWDETFTAYATGHVFMYNSWPDTVAFIEDSESSNVAGLNDYFNPPIVEGSGGYNVIADMADWVIWKSSQRKEAAFLLIQYLNSYEAQLAVQRANGCTHDPRVMALPEIQKKYPWFPATLALMEEGKILGPPGYSWIPQTYDILAEVISKSAADMMSAKNAMDEVQERTKKII